MPQGSDAEEHPHRENDAQGHEHPDPEGSPDGKKPAAENEPSVEAEDPVEATFERSVREGARRLNRSWRELLATGAVGGLDVATGVLALLLVEDHTGDSMLGSIAFGVGFVALVLGSSELFTEHFLLPVTARVARRSEGVFGICRLWSLTLVTNLLGGWVAMALIAAGFPVLRHTALHLAMQYPAQGIGWRSFALALLGGMVITLMTWMERGTESAPAKLVAVWIAAFLLAAGPLDHVVIMSLEMSVALVYGAPFGYVSAIGIAAWAALGNIVGGVGLVTVLRLVQVGRGTVQANR